MTVKAQKFASLLEQVCTRNIGPAAAAVDANGEFPYRSIDALKTAGLMGAVSAREAGGLGLGFGAAAAIVRRVAQECGSTAMVLCMHYCGAAVLEAYAPLQVFAGRGQATPRSARCAISDRK